LIRALAIGQATAPGALDPAEFGTTVQLHLTGAAAFRHDGAACQPDLSQALLSRKMRQGVHYSPAVPKFESIAQRSIVPF
jgi:hypothetical protein